MRWDHMGETLLKMIRDNFRNGRMCPCLYQMSLR